MRPVPSVGSATSPAFVLPGKELWGIHLAALIGVLATGWSWSGCLLAIALYYVRMAFVCIGYHRYFSHRAFRTSRAFQALLAFLAQTSAQKGALWWAANHRLHHRHSDRREDPHSPRLRGLWWSHVGWIVGPEHRETQWREITDLTRYPELVWLNRFKLFPVVIYGATCLLLGGTRGFVWGFLVSTVLLWHGTFAINSLAHRFGRQRYSTGDDSRNGWVLALLTLGEGWHNNHHAYPSASRQGFFWWELDPAYYLLQLLALFGLVWDVREPPRRYLYPAPSSLGSGQRPPFERQIIDSGKRV